MSLAAPPICADPSERFLDMIESFDYVLQWSAGVDVITAAV